MRDELRAFWNAGEVQRLLIVAMIGFVVGVFAALIPMAFE